MRAPISQMDADAQAGGVRPLYGDCGWVIALLGQMLAALECGHGHDSLDRRRCAAGVGVILEDIGRRSGAVHDLFRARLDR